MGSTEASGNAGTHEIKPCAGYDGKGQRWVRNLGEAEMAFDELGGKPCILETCIAIQTEISVVIARGVDGRVVSYPPSENCHHEGILDVSIVPARISPEIGARATQITIRIAEFLEYCGVMAVEFFITKEGNFSGFLRNSTGETGLYCP